MFLRIILAVIFLWALFRLLRSLTQYLSSRSRRSRPSVHTRGRRRRNPLEGQTIIDVDYTETDKSGDSGDRSPGGEQGR